MIRPVGATGAETPRPPQKESLEDLARDVLEKGVEIRAPRKWWFGTKSLDADKAAHEIRDGNPRLTVRQPNNDLALPLKSEQDLAELAVFHAARPAASLAHPELAEAVQNLQHLGFQLIDGSHRDLGAYGAYNAVTDPAHELGGLSAGLSDRSLPLNQGNLAQMSEFYANNPLGRLELDGYQFFDARNERRFAFGPDAPAMVGENGEAWLKPEGPDLKERLEAFAVLRKETDDLARSQQIAQLDANRTNGWSLINESQCRPGVLRAGAKLTTDQLLHLAGSVELDAEGRDAWLGLLEQRPETATAARLGRAMLQNAYLEETRDLAWSTVLTHARMASGVEAASALKAINAELAKREWRDDDQIHFAGAALTALQAFPDTAPAAKALADWQSDDPYALVTKLLENPTDSSQAALVELAKTQTSAPTQGRILAQMGAHSARARIAAELHAALPYTQSAVFPLGLEGPQVTSGAEAASLLKEIRGQVNQLDGRYGFDREPFASNALRLLAAYPDTRAAAEQVQKWQPSALWEVVGGLLEEPTDASPARMRGVAARIQSDPEAQKRVLDGHPACVGELFDAAQSDEVRNAIFRSALAHPTLPDGAEAIELMKGFTQAVSDGYYDSSTLGPVMLKTLQSFPDTKALADRVEGWKSSSVYAFARALLTETNIDKVAEACDPGDSTAQQAILAELNATHARQLWDAVEDGDSRKSILLAALHHKTITSGVELGAMLSEITGSVRNHYHYDATTVAGKVIEQLQSFPDTREAAARVASWQVADPTAVASALLKNPTDATPAGLRTLAGKIDESDLGAQTRVLEQMKADPATQKAAELALPLMTSLDYSNGKAFQSALACHKVESGADAARFYQDLCGRIAQGDSYYRSYSEIPLAQSALAELQKFPDTAAAAARVAAWQAANPYPLVQALLARPTDATPEAMRSLARDADPYDQALHVRILEADRGTPAADAGLDLLSRLQSPESRKSALVAALNHHGATTGPEMAAMLASIRVDDSYDNQTMSQGSLDVLKRYPETKAGAEAVAAWGANQPLSLVKALLKDPVAPDLRKIAACVDPNDFAGQEGILKWLAADPATARAASVAQALCARTEWGETRAAVVKASLQQAELSTGAEAAGLMRGVLAQAASVRDYYGRDSQTALANEALHQLEQFSDTRAAAQAVTAWQAQYPVPVTTELLKNPTDASAEALRTVARQIETYDQTAQDNVLNQLKADPATQKAAELGAKLMAHSDYEHRDVILKAVLKHHSVPSGAEAAALLKDCFKDSLADEISQSLAATGLEVLQQYPDTKAAADRVASWKPQRPHSMVRELVKAPTDASVEGLRKVAGAGEEEDPLFYQGVLNGLADPANRDLGQQGVKHLQSTVARRKWTSEVLAHGPIRTGVELAELIGRVKKDIARVDRWERGDDMAGLTRAATELLAGFPDTAVAGQHLKAWGEGSDAEARLDFWLADPTLAKPENYFERAQAIVQQSDSTMQNALLEELGQEPSLKTTGLMARAAMAEVEYDETRFAMFRAALALGEVRGTADVERFFKNVRELGATWEDARLDELQELYKMSFGLQGRSADTLAEEEGRVLVGGVVIKKKD